MKKTLQSLLEQNKFKKVNVKIGSKGGSSFWYCGKANPIYSLPALKTIRATLLKRTHKEIENLKYRYDHIDEIYAKNIEDAKERVKDFEAYKKRMVIRKQNEIVNIPKKIASLEYDVATKLVDRPVLEVVEGISPDEKPCFVVYVKGNEKGAYWTIKEFNKRRKNNDTQISLGKPNS